MEHLLLIILKDFGLLVNLIFFLLLLHVDDHMGS
jgi:hypothetical protein